MPSVYQLTAIRLRSCAGVLLLAGVAQALGADPPAPAPAATPPAITLRNGGMTQGDAVPDDWEGKFGDVSVARDTATFRAAPASLRVTVAGGKSGQAFQEIHAGANAKITLAGWIKTRGNVRAQVAVQAFAEGYKRDQFLQVHFVQGETDWTKFEKSITLPPWTSFFHVLLMAEGNGTAWLDEVHEASAPVDPGRPRSAQERMTAGPPPKDRPSVPGWGFYPSAPKAWLAFHEANLERTRRGGVGVFFLGDSVTEGWSSPDGGRALFEKRYAPLGAANYGRGGDSTRQVLWRLQHGEIDGISPRLVVLMIGTNNLYDDFNGGTDEEIADGIKAVVETLRARLPRTRILLLGILPRQNAYFSNRIAAINTRIRTLDDAEHVRFLDIGDRFQTAAGEVKPELFTPDRLHLSPRGYEVWADAMQPLFDTLSRPPASAPATLQAR